MYNARVTYVQSQYPVNPSIKKYSINLLESSYVNFQVYTL